MLAKCWSCMLPFPTLSDSDGPFCSGIVFSVFMSILMRVYEYTHYRVQEILYKKWLVENLNFIVVTVTSFFLYTTVTSSSLHKNQLVDKNLPFLINDNACITTDIQFSDFCFPFCDQINFHIIVHLLSPITYTHYRL